MKLRKFVAISFAIILVLSAILTLAPFFSLLHSRNGYVSAVVNGAYVDYEFHDTGIYSYINGTPAFLSQSGTITLTIGGNSAHMNIFISGPPFKGTPNNFTYTRDYETNVTMELGNPFVENFINNFTGTPGSLISIDGSRGVVERPLGHPFFINTNGEGKQAAIDSQGIGYTNPEVINFTSINQNYNPGFKPYENYFLMDKSGQYNILVDGMMLQGAIGISPFLKQLLSDTNINKPVLNVTEFTINVAKTNILLEPVDITHYLAEYAFFVAITWILGTTFVALTVRNSRVRNQAVHKSIGKRRK